MIKISHIKWSGRKIGIALHKLKDGFNEVQITAKDKDGNLRYPNHFIIDRQHVINIYGVSIINKNNLEGIWIPLTDIERGYFKK